MEWFFVEVDFAPPKDYREPAPVAPTLNTPAAEEEEEEEDEFTGEGRRSVFLMCISFPLPLPVSALALICPYCIDLFNLM